MMKLHIPQSATVRRVVLLTLALVAVFIIVGFFLPAQWRVERQVVIAAPPAAVFPYLNDLKQWRAWTVWYAGKPDLKVEYSGPAAGVGATSRWQDEDGRGVMKIMDSRRNGLVEYTLVFDGGEFVMHGSLRLLPEPGGTRVVWRVVGDVETNPLRRYFAQVVRLWVGGDVKDSLEQLRVLLEKKNLTGRE